MTQNEQIVNKCNELLARLEAKLSTGKTTAEPAEDDALVNADACLINDSEIIRKKTESDRNEIQAMIRNVANPVFLERECDSDRKSDIALIQAFYGTDVRRVKATVSAVMNMLKSKPRPAEWIFVESQASKAKAAFGWLASYGIRYEFVKCGKDSEGLFLKPSLWNIGVKKVKSDKFVFLDSDVSFCSSNWCDAVSDALSEYDVVSPHGWSYYANGKQNNRLCESIGHSLMSSGNKRCDGHIGFAVGMTRRSYDMMNGFRPCSFRHSDNLFWETVLGTETRPQQLGWSPYRSDGSYGIRYGLPLSVGSTDVVCCHFDHGNISERKYVDNGLITWYGVSERHSEMSVLQNGLPVWSDTPAGRIMRNMRKRLDCEERFDVRTALTEEIETEYGRIDNTHPLFVVTCFKPAFSVSLDDVFRQLDAFAATSRTPFTYVCFVDADKREFEAVRECAAVRRPDLAITFVHGQFDGKRLADGKYEFQPNSSILACDVKFTPTDAFSLPVCPNSGLDLAFAFEKTDCVKYIPYTETKSKRR